MRWNASRTVERIWTQTTPTFGNKKKDTFIAFASRSDSRPLGPCALEDSALARASGSPMSLARLLPGWATMHVRKRPARGIALGELHDELGLIVAERLEPAGLARGIAGGLQGV